MFLLKTYVLETHRSYPSYVNYYYSYGSYHNFYTNC